MFGIDKITWSTFLLFISLCLAAWYFLLLAYCWSRSKQNAKEQHFETGAFENTSCEGFQPIAVYANDFPSKILPVNPVQNQPVGACMYEETGMDEGMELDHFTQKNHPVLAAKIDDFQHQQ